ncbi:hypothetical protein N9L19_01355 [bacterium]|nr:hypothetical protein [bacterium]
MRNDPISAKKPRFACCNLQCMRWKKALPMKETLSTSTGTTFPPLLLEGKELLAFRLLLESGVRVNAEGRTCGFGTEPDVEGGDTSVRSLLHDRFDAFLLEEEPQMLQGGPQSGGLPRQI